MGRMACYCAVFGMALGGQAAGQALHVEDFNAGDGGYSTSDLGDPEGPWTHDAARGTWRCDGSASLGASSASFLTSPAIAVTRDGQVILELTHRYSGALVRPPLGQPRGL